MLRSQEREFILDREMTNKIDHEAAVARIADFSGDEEEIREQLDTILASPAFNGSRRSQEFLKFVVDKALTGQFDDLKERILGIELFARKVSYDTSQDAIVRVTANDVRKRLGQYYKTAGYPSSILIDLPSGSYIPKFGRPAVPLERFPARETAVLAVPLAATRTARRGWIHLPAYVLAILGVTLSIWLAARGSWQSSSKLPLPWSAIFQKHAQPQLIFSDASILMLEGLLHNTISLSDYAMHEFTPKSSALTPESANFLKLLAGPNFTVAAAPVDVRIVSMISEMAGAQASGLRLRSAREMQFRDFKSDSDFILLGSPRSNPWTGLFRDQLDFSFVPSTGEGPETCRNARPKPGELPAYVSTASGGETGQAYAIAAFIRNPDQNGNVIVLAGSDAEGTEAAADFMTNAELLSGTLRAHGISPAGPLVHFEALLRLTTMAGSPNKFKVIALHRL